MTTIEIKTSQIRLHARPKNKNEAIEQVGQLLVDSGNIEAGYITSMKNRERVANTYLGNGITLPYGLPENREMIRHTGVAILQVPDGVTWNPSETARLIVGIAAKSDEHILVLRRLTRVLGDEALVERLSHTDDPLDIIEALTGERTTEAPAATQTTNITGGPAAHPATKTMDDYEQFFDAIVLNATGLHARPAATFVSTAKRFKADIHIRKDQRVSNGKSLLSVLQLGAEHSAKIRVSAQGIDAAEALKTLQEALANKLGDVDEPVQTPQPASKTSTITEQGWKPQSVHATLSGIPASTGIVIGPVYRYTRQALQVEDTAEDPIVASARLQGALNKAQKELKALYQDIQARSGADKAAIFQAHSEMLEDTGLLQQTVALILEGHSAGWSWQHVINEQAQQLQQINDPILSARANDLQDVSQRVLQYLVTGQNVDNGQPAPMIGKEPVILLAEDLAPSDTATLDPKNVLGFCTAGGGPTSHTAIIARSLEIPAIVGAGPEVMSIAEGALCILDGKQGKLYIQPGEADIAHARELQQQEQTQLVAEKARRFEPAMTPDGHHIEVAANIGNEEDARRAAEAGAEGVGLMRTEFLFLSHDSAPDEEEQFTVYRDIVQTMNNKPVIIRTLDIGGDKHVPYLNLPHEENPFLGIRGVRLSLAHPDLFRTQLRAIYRAAAYGPIRIMFPMIATLDDWEKARSMAEGARQELNVPEIPLGIMVEVPSAVLLADQLAESVTFFSIGTNDLTQYVLAMDRGHPELAKQADALHPAVLRSIAQTVQAANKAGKRVGVCGNLASDPLGAEILIGLGVTELSASIPAVATIKAHLRTISLPAMQEKAQRALTCRSAVEVRKL